MNKSSADRTSTNSRQSRCIDGWLIRRVQARAAAAFDADVALFSAAEAMRRTFELKDVVLEFSVCTSALLLIRRTLAGC
jgi:hypothetical protein